MNDGKTRIYLIRHGEALGNVKRIFHGHTDSPLTPKGHLQAEMVARGTDGLSIDAIYSSDLIRAFDTASYIARRRNLEITRDKGLREIFGGQWEDKPWSQLPLMWPKEYYLWENAPHLHVMPGGESMDELLERTTSCIDNIISENPGKNLCLVTHGAAIRAFTCLIVHNSLEKLNTIPWVDNTSISVVSHFNGKYTMINQSITDHLNGDLGTIENQDWWMEKGDL